jgi:dienelactone hydrolase
MITKDIVYKSGDKTLTGYLACDDSRGPGRPGVLVCHQGNGLSAHTKERARMLAERGYVAFALDMYGEPVTGREQAMALLQGLMNNPTEMMTRARAGLDVLAAQANVDAKRLAAIGYCFGGSVVLEMARAIEGMACVVAFHPGLNGLPEKDERKIRCKVMVCAGADDPLIPADARERFIALMKASGADWQYLTYGNAGHSFTDTSVDAMGMAGFAYHAATDARSWAAMRGLFDETLGATRAAGRKKTSHSSH